MNWDSIGGWIGGIVGGVAGLAGAALGVWCTLRSCQGPRERTFVWKATLLCGLLVAALLAGLLWLPSPWGYGLFLPYAILLVLGIRHWNSVQARIRAAEAAERAAGEDSPP
jgi:peptidoglycan biosynthesis protein MviN/MurJ (putative lipid II flippase)